MDGGTGGVARRVAAALEVHVRVDEQADVLVAGLHGDGQRRRAVVVAQVQIDVLSAPNRCPVRPEEDEESTDLVSYLLGEQEADDGHVAVLGGAHERRAAVGVLDVDVGAALQQQAHHVDAAVRHGQHQRRLAVLRRFGVDVGQREKPL